MQKISALKTKVTASSVFGALILATAISSLGMLGATASPYDGAKAHAPIARAGLTPASDIEPDDAAPHGPEFADSMIAEGSASLSTVEEDVKADEEPSDEASSIPETGNQEQDAVTFAEEIVLVEEQMEPATSSNKTSKSSSEKSSKKASSKKSKPPRDPSLPDDYEALTWEAFKNKTLDQKIALIGALARQDMKESGVLASVTAAQCILESGWMESGLAKHNGMFGIKAGKLENNWKDSTWTGTFVRMKTGEEYKEGEITKIVAAFRTYSCVWDSVKDHSAYLIHAHKSKNELRYPGIAKIRDPRKAVELIKAGGYATSSKYVDKVMSVIERYSLTKFDK